MSESTAQPPLTLRMHDRDNVAIVANHGGLVAGTALPGGLVLVDRVPQGHKVALVPIPAHAPVLRYGIRRAQTRSATHSFNEYGCTHDSELLSTHPRSTPSD